MNKKKFCTIYCSDTQSDLELKAQFVLHRF